MSTFRKALRVYRLSFHLETRVFSKGNSLSAENDVTNRVPSVPPFPASGLELGM